MWQLDCEESWALKNWCFWTVVLEKTLESPLDCKETQLVHSEGDQPWDIFGRNDAKAETPVLLPGKSHAWRSLVGYSRGHYWGHSLSLFTSMHWRRKWQPTPVFLPENPRDGEAWWAAIYGVAQSQTRLEWLSSSSSKITADGDCSHEIKRCLLLGSKIMTNLDIILKSRAITLSTKVCLVKTMVFPYG